MLLLYNVKIIAKSKKCWLFQYLRGCENFISLITFYCNSRNIEENKISGYRSMFRQRMRHLQDASDNLVVEMQTTDEKFFNYFIMIPP